MALAPMTTPLGRDLHHRLGCATLNQGVQIANFRPSVVQLHDRPRDKLFGEGGGGGKEKSCWGLSQKLGNLWQQGPVDTSVRTTEGW